VLEAPESASERLVPHVPALGQARDPLRAGAGDGPQSSDREIRLTYGELTALIRDAVKNLKD
jgi:hypothetical protein